MDDMTREMLTAMAVYAGIVALQGIFGCLEVRRRKDRERDRELEEAARKWRGQNRRDDNE